MTIDELDWFVVLAETEHMTETAGRLNIAQPTLSRSLARLEHRLGVPLFDRVNRRLRLNRFGEILLEHGRRSLAELDSAAERIAGLADPARGVVRLAFLHSVATWLVPEMLRGYRELVPEVRFELTQAAGADALDALRTGHAELAVTSPRSDGEDLGWHPLHRELLCLAVPADHPLAGRDRCPLAAASAEPFVVLRPGSGMREISDELLDHAGFAPSVAFESTEIPSMEGLVAAGLGVAVVPRPRPYRATPGVRYLPLTDAGAHRVIGMAWPRGRVLPPVAERFAEFVRARHWSAD
ncbi:MAG TPA: LysR family transcriptional regulator [Pseudonocardia sp.]